MSKLSKAPTSRPVHPCLMSVFDGTMGAEYSTWARLTSFQIPNLVTAHSNTLRVYTLDQESGTLILTQSFTNLAGSVCFLETLRAADVDSKCPDDLLIGFAGNPRLAIVSLSKSSASSSNAGSPLLLATSLLDLTPALNDHCMGSVTPLEQDMVASVEHKNPNIATVSVVLGGGICVAAMTLRRITATEPEEGDATTQSTVHNGWHVSEPFILSLSSLQVSLNTASKKLAAAVQNAKGASQAAAVPNAVQQSIAHGFGDILSVCFLRGYVEPTICILHSGKNGRATSGRLGRPNGHGSTRFGMVVTAISVTVSHRRCASLWSVEVPADALELMSFEKGCLLMSVNSILQISQAGRVMNMLGVNGWVRSSAPASLMKEIQPNPSPLPKLSIQLDGAHMTFLADGIAAVALRGGQLYLLQPSGKQLSLMPIGHKLGSIGHVANIIALPFKDAKDVGSKLVKFQQDSSSQLSMGLIFAGSRMGDSSLLGYAIQSGVSLSIDHLKTEDGGNKRVKLEETQSKTETSDDSNDYDRILQLEEDALYAPVEEADEVHIVPPSDDDDDDNDFKSSEGTNFGGKRKRPLLHDMTIVRSLTALDIITALGPLGPGCDGPLARSTPIASMSSDTGSTTSGLSKTEALSATAQVLPCGYGSSGGLVLLTALGRDDRTIIAEADCLNVQGMFGLPKQGIVLLPMSGPNSGIQGVNILRMQRSEENNAIELGEVPLEELCSPSPPGEEETLRNPTYLFTKTTLLGASEFSKSQFLVLVREDRENDDPTFAVVVLSEIKKRIEVVYVYDIGLGMGIMLSATPMLCHNTNGNVVATFGSTWSSGSATITSIECIDANDIYGSQYSILGGTTMDSSLYGEAVEDDEAFYESDKITACDVFTARNSTFSTPARDDGGAVEGFGSNGSKILDEFDEEDIELYGLQSANTPSDKNTLTTSASPQSTDTDTSRGEEIYVAICRQSGCLQVFKLSDFASAHTDPEPIWEAPGLGNGVTELINSKDAKTRIPVSHKASVTEFRFFYTGPSKPQLETNPFPNDQFRTLCIVAETNLGDIYLYKVAQNNLSRSMVTFSRVSLGIVARSSIEQTRHRAKLRRKGIISASADEEAGALTSLRHNRLYSFKEISGQDGLFAATARPMWFVSERGNPTFLCHRSRHVAPAGGKARPVAGFCSGLLGGGGFLTLHERIGRVGTQRLTVFNGISNIYPPQGLLPGSGLCVEKIPLGVTVRKVQFIDDTTVSSRERPLYALLISSESEVDQSALNDDGLSAEERQRLIDEKEAEKVKRQVEADLGGFDVEQEWVEEIERENCFEVDKDFGGAPPIKKTTYALWIVDASDNWGVVDSHELGEFEHGLAMNVMPLTDVEDEIGASSAIEDSSETDSMFIAVGTAIIDQDGEDVASKGRVLLFQVKKTELSGSQLVELEMVCEKDVLHGPVTTLSCLTCEGRHRLVIGAGSDVNVEQWGNGKLTQVGFFRATMQILDIILFKTFFLLMDAYDSLHFLVWRESDKSLTLLAKDYEPTPVYSAGILSRGGSVSFVCQDDRQNLQFFQYAPGDAAARGGNKLVCRADIHLGAQTVSMQSHFCRSSLLINSATPESTLAALKQQDSFFGRTDDDQRLGVYFGTSDGGYVATIPLSEQVYWRLTALQSVMNNAMESNCALNHKAWRLYRRSPRRGGCRSNDRKKGVIDGDLITKYADLPMADQEDLASAIGSTVEQILDNILELNCSSTVV